MLTPYLPWPLHSGGQIRTYNLLKNLAYKHEITLFSFIRSHEEKKYVRELEPYCASIQLFKRTKTPWAARNILLSGFTPYPFLVSIYLSSKARIALKQELSQRHYDIIHAETFYVMPNIPKTTIPTLLVEQTIEYLGYQTYTVQKAPLILKPLLAFDVAKLRWWETIYWRRADRLVAMSEEDRLWIQRLVPDAHVSVVANGIDVEYFKHTSGAKYLSPTVLFVGNYKWLPNVDAATYLVRRVWPLIHAAVPNAKLHIVGRNPTGEIRALGKHEGVQVVGEVDDIRQPLSKAHVMLVPIRNGRGTRYKILESMAAGLPVVSTSLGIEGINADNGIHALVRDTAEELAKATVQLLTRRDLAKKLSKNAQSLVTTSFNWGKISSDLDTIYQQLGEK